MNMEDIPSAAANKSLDHHTRACLNLWATVMAQGIREAKWGRLEAKRWVASENEHPGSFRWMCSLFDYDPDFIRRAIASYRPSPDQSQPEDVAFFD